MDYVHALRLEEAKQMLETTELSVEAIANEVGFEDASFFGRLFGRSADTRAIPPAVRHPAQGAVSGLRGAC